MVPDPHFQKPRESATRKTFRSVHIGLRLTMVVTRQMFIGVLQSTQRPRATHGTSIPSLRALAGAARFFILLNASLRSSTSLLAPARTITVSGPNIIPATRLPMPSVLTSSPSMVIALLEQRKYLHVMAALTARSVFENQRASNHLFSSALTAVSHLASKYSWRTTSNDSAMSHPLLLSFGQV